VALPLNQDVLMDGVAADDMCDGFGASGIQPSRATPYSLLTIIGAVVLLTIPGCGGGSDPTASPLPPPPPPPPTQTYEVSPSTATASFTVGSPAPITVTIKPSPMLSGTVYLAIENAASAVESSSTVTINSDGSYTLTTMPLASLAPGSHKGQFGVSICGDQACKSPFSGSPVSVPFDFEIAALPAPVTLNPGTLSGHFVAGDAFPFRLLTTATPAAAVGINLNFASVDPSNIFTGGVTAMLSGGTFLLALNISQSLVQGHYTGTVQLKVCNDGTCSTQLGGSPLLVPYDITIDAPAVNGGLTTLSPLNGVPAWEMFQGNAAHTGYVPVTLDPTHFASRALKRMATFLNPVVVENGIVYVTNPPFLYALRESDLSTLWTFDFSPIGVTSSPSGLYALNPPSVNAGKVYVTTCGQQNTFLFVFDANTGQLLFQTPFGAQWEHYLAPTVDGGVIFEDGGGYGGMFAFDATNGATLYYTSLQQFDEWTPAVDGTYAYAYIGGQTAYTPAQLNVIDRRSGVLVASILDSTYQWAGYSMHSAPVIGAPGSVVAVNTGNPSTNELIDFDIQNNSIRWHFAGQYRGNPAYHAGKFYAWNAQPLQLEVRSETDGSLLWSWAAPAGSNIQGIENDVLLTDNLVFVSTGTATFAIDLLTHQSAWTLPYGGRLAMSNQGVLYLATHDPLDDQLGWLAAINVR
jgi:outer membrane protein assembly factor BamB